MDPARLQAAWLSRISREEKAHRDFRDRSIIVEKVFNAGGSDSQYELTCVPLYWSVVQTEHAGVYSNQPAPDVRPRNEHSNPVYKDVARVIERGLNHCVDHQSFDETMHRVVDDYLAIGLATPRVKVDSVMETVEEPIMGIDPVTGQQVQMGTRPVEQVGDQYIRWEYVPWRRIGWEPCNNPKHCTWIYFRHRMTQVQIKKRFGRAVNASKDEKDRGDINDWKSNTFDIYEVWDKNTKQVLFIAKGESEPLEINPDPLELTDFFPIPQLMMTNVCSEELIPKADYDYIESYDLELQRLQERRAATVEQIKATGVFDAGMPELAEVLDMEDGEMLPIDNLMQRMSAAGGADGLMWFQDNKPKLEALQTITEQYAIIKAQVDEILGISDIVRGVTNAAETATAQEIKGRWAGIRLTRKRECVIYTVREMMRIMSQLLASHITPENLARMTQMEITQQMQQILQDDMLMEFVIDIETDSTVAKDEEAERQSYQEMLANVGQYAQSVMPLVQNGVMPADTASAILSAALRPFARKDRGLDEAINQLPQTAQQLQQLNQQVQDLTTQNQQAQQELQQWQAYAQGLQQQATQAKSEREVSQAELNKAKTRETMAKLPASAIEVQQSIADIGNTEADTGKKQAETDNLRRGPLQ